MNDFNANTQSTLEADIKILKERYNNLNIFEINLRENNSVIKKLIDDLSWAELLSPLSSNTPPYKNLQKNIKKLILRLNEWEAAESSNAGFNSVLLNILIQKIDDCHITLIKLFLYFNDCPDEKLNIKSEEIYKNNKSYQFAQYLRRAKQSFMVQEEKLDFSYDIDYKSLLQKFCKHFTLFLPTNNISLLLFMEIKSSLAFGESIGLSRLEELFDIILGSLENFKIFLNKNLCYCKIENAFEENKISLANIFGSRENTKKFEIELKKNDINLKSEKVVLDCGGQTGCDRFRQCKLATIGKNVDDFENDVKLVNLNNIDTVSAIIYLRNSQFYLIDIGELSLIKLYAKPKKRVQLKNGMRIFLGSQTVIEVYIQTAETIKLEIFFNNIKQISKEGIEIETINRISIGALESSKYKVSDPDIGKGIEIYRHSHKFYFKSFNECTSFNLKTLEEIKSQKCSRPFLLENDHTFTIIPFWFDVSISN